MQATPGPTNSQADRCRGALIGLAAGDRNGGPTRMALALAASLVAQQAFDRADVLSRYVRWWRADGADSGPVAAAVLDRVARGTDPALAVDRVDREINGMTAGVNPAHRSVPLAMAAFVAEDHLASIAAAEATLTHKHPLAGDISASVVLLCRALVVGRTWNDAVSLATAGRSEAVVEALREGPVRPGGIGGYAPEVLQTAAHFVANAPDFASALETSLEYAGPANYAPVLVGAIGGARWGAAQAGPSLRKNRRAVDVISRLSAIADALGATWI